MLLLLTLFGCRPPAGPVSESAALTLLHTNDMHCHFLPERADWLDGEPSIGGFAELDAWVQGLRAEGSPTLLLDAGDILTGTPLAEIEVDGARGGGMLALMEAVGYDAWVLGNHEFDQGYDNTAAMVAAADMPTLSANLESPEGGPAMPGLQDAVVLTAGELRVGVIGATTEGLTHLAPLDVNERVVVRGVAEAVAEQVEALEGQVDLIVALTHVGVDGDRELAREVDGIDVIVGGHSHTRLEAPVREGDTWIVQAGSYTRSLGVSRLGFVDGELSDFSDELVHMVPGEAPGAPSAEVLGLIEDYAGRIEARYGEEIGHAQATLTRDYHHESDLGNFITDALREATGADLALYNAGGLRADLVEGTITRRSIYEILPFGNQVVVFEITGEELERILLHNAWTALKENSGASQLSGVRMTWREVGGRPELVSAEIAGAPLDPSATYTVASNSYVVERAEIYLNEAQPQDPRGFGRTSYEVVTAAVEAAGEVPVPERGRWVKVD
ncbi:MAG: bifunctional metallophosphatase/5'-nucleotidase [Alphaproteobacteria bacterium]|nr:bifunctional metallophosphatase/5'-nucleotidase [Alphaproteobacteria bacterium]MCB9791619.1 bifunctional metallophosphatase/5'-nucleotidase [Alphaproteobacteria bacterium]